MKNIDSRTSIDKDSFSELIGFLDSLPEPRLVIDTNYQVVGANKAYQAVFGASKILIGRKCHEVSHHYPTPCDQHGEACPLSAARETKETSREFHVHFTPRGQEHVRVELTPILDKQGTPVLYVETLSKQVHSSAVSSNESLVGKSHAFMKMLGLVDRAAPSDVAVLLLGESGTGKEEISQLLHKKSNRANQSFVIVECSGLTESLFESEMFGHEKGSFTGAILNKKGLIEVANGGTLFLDEIGDIPLNLQVKLLRMIESRTYRRVGGTEVLKCDFRLICATHRNLDQMVRDGTFRADLYYRISPFKIALPALRERKEDIVILAKSLLERIVPGRDLDFSESAVEFLEEHEYIGNIRELRNMLERASLMTDGTKVLVEHLISDFNLTSDESVTKIKGCGSCRMVRPIQEIESKYLQCLIREHGENIEFLAKGLCVSKRTLYRMINKISGKTVITPLLITDQSKN